MLNVALTVVAAIALLFMFHPRLTKNHSWQATLTPLSSIIGSGFLVIAPLLASVVGDYSPIAVAGIVLLAYGIGGVIRYNILHVEPLLRQEQDQPAIQNLELIANVGLSLAYVTAVAFYLSLLSSFLLYYAGLGHSPTLERSLTTIIIVLIATTGFMRGLGGLEKLEAYSMSLQLSIVAALLIGVSIYGYHFLQSGEPLSLNYQDRDWITKVCILGGILLVVQGFETSRFLGEKYSPEVRVRTMRRAQIISGALYVMSVAALMPIVQHLNLEHIQIAEIVSATGLAASALPLMLIVAAIMSQFSAAVADTVGAGGLVNESCCGKLSTNVCYIAVSICAVMLVWTADLLEIISFASRAFALYYLLQCVLALMVSQHLHRHRKHRRHQTYLHRTYCATVAAILAFIVVFAIPAE